jgi:hypothetical protein
MGPLIGLVGIVLAAAFFMLGRRARLKQPTWAVRSNNLVRNFSSTLPGLDIRFDGKKVETLTISRIAFWSRGMATIDRNDIAPADPLRIVGVGGAQLLDVKLVQVNSEPSQFAAKLNPEGREAHLTFDFLDHDQGAVFQVIHTGTSSNDVTVVGTIKGAGTPVKRRVRRTMLPLFTTPEFDRKLKPRTRRRVTIACEVVAALVLVVVIALSLGPKVYPPLREATEAWQTFRKAHPIIIGIIEMASVYVTSLVVLFRLATFRSAILPDGLMAFENDLREIPSETQRR